MAFPLRLPVGTSSFAQMREGNELYIDKTAHIADMLDHAGRYCFLVRPRRFGKSLLVSTLEHLFHGHVDLFRDTVIHARRPRSGHWVWPAPAPVIRLNMNVWRAQDAVSLERGLQACIYDLFDRFALAHLARPSSEPGYLFGRLLSSLAARGDKVVVLIDEYDYPILHNLARAALPEIQEVLANFYGVLKNHDEDLRFVFITGVTRFARMGLFSGLNNLYDLSHDHRFHGLLGFTQAEVDRHLTPFMAGVTDLQGDPVPDVATQVRAYYNGYGFAPHLPAAERVYNPFTLVTCLQHGKLAHYWAETGLPGFLPKLLLAQQLTVADLRGLSYKHMVEGVLRPEHLVPLWRTADHASSQPSDVLTLARLMFQTGYLTLVSDPATGQSVTDFPNLEVTAHFATDLVLVMTRNPRFDFHHLTDVCDAVSTCNPADMQTACNDLFAQLTYYGHEPREFHYQSLVHVALLPLRHRVHLAGEVALHQGRSDLIVDMPRATVIMELKMDTRRESPLQQIRDRDYARKYRAEDKPVHLWGITVGSQERQITRIETQVLPASTHAEEEVIDVPAVPKPGGRESSPEA